MNHIGPAPIPTAPPSKNPNPPFAPDRELPDDHTSFDSLLQKSSDEPAEDTKKNPPADAPGQTAVVDSKSDAAVQADIAAMFTAPPAAPQPEPIPLPQSEGISAEPAKDDDARETTTIAPEIPSGFPAQPATLRPTINFPTAPLPTHRHAAAIAAPLSPAPLSPATASPQTSPTAAQSAPEAETSSAGSKPLPPELVAPPLEVVNVLGIIPPVQTAPEPAADKVSAPDTRPAIAAPPAPAVPKDNISPKVNIPESAIPQTPQTATDVFEPSAPAFSQPSPEPHAEPELVAGLVATPPANSTVRNEQPLPAPAPTPARPLIGEPVNVISGPETNAGMTAAKPGSVMSAPTPQRPQRPTPANPATVAPFTAAPRPATNDGTQTLRSAPPTPPQNAREHSANQHSDNPANPATVTPEITPSIFSSEPASANLTSNAPVSIRPADVAQVVTHTLQATERLRASGQDRMEVALTLDSGHELTIQLRVANGQVTPIIRTESEPLRAALEQNWARFSQRGGDSELHISRPVFESPQTSSNMSDLNQQRDGRQRAFQEPAQEFYQNQTPRRNPLLNTPRPATPAETPTTGVSLYA